MSNPTYIAKTLTWTSGIKTLSAPWSNFTFLSKNLKTGDFSVGNPIAIFDIKAFPKTIPARIGAIVYNTDIPNGKTTAVPVRGITSPKSRTPYPIGFILVDEAGEIVAVPGDGGVLSFYIEVTDTTDQDILCFFKLVWQEQCEFAKCTLNYLNLLQFGAVPCDALDELMNKRRALEILNCYDVRDIPNNTTDYNILTYAQIKKLLNT